MDPIAEITRSIAEVGELARAGGVKVETQLGEIVETAKGLNQRILDVEQKMVVLAKDGPLRGAGGADQVFNVVAAIAGDERLTELRTGNAQRVNIEIKQSLRTILKSVLTNTGQGGDSPATNFPSPTEYLTPSPTQAPGRRLKVLQSLPSRSMGGASATNPRINSQNDGSAPQSYEGAPKGESHIDVTGEILSYPTIATYLNASKQVINDNAALIPFLNQWLTYYVMRNLENKIISGDGGSTDKILGLINQGIPYASTSDHGVDRIGEASAVGLAAHGYVGGLIILSSFDYFKILSARDANHRFIGAGWSAPIDGSLWGIPVADSPGCPNGTAIVLDLGLVTILDREQANIQIGYTGTQFTSNEATILAELRANLAVTDPNAVMIVDLPTDSLSIG